VTLYIVTVTGGSPVEVYGGLAACDNALRYKSGAGGKKYRALIAASNDDERKRLLASATQWIDDILAAGTPTGAGGTTLQVPLEDVMHADGSAMSDAEQLAIAERATFEAVAILAADNDAASAVDTGSNIRKLDADGTSIEFFRPTSALDGTASTLPAILSRLLARLIAAAAGDDDSTAIGGASYGTDATSSFDDCDAYRRTEPL
jgi:hypothetical protein